MLERELDFEMIEAEEIPRVTVSPGSPGISMDQDSYLAEVDAGLGQGRAAMMRSLTVTCKLAWVGQPCLRTWAVTWKLTWVPEPCRMLTRVSRLEGAPLQ